VQDAIRGGARTSELLDDVQRAAAAIEEAQRELREAVSRAHRAGYSYGAIAETLGVSRQAARERFSRRHGES
jgi:DNA-directed RNA polymerase specialized sigma24 family protein